MAGNEEEIYKKWFNAKFDGKVVLSVTKKDQYINAKLSLINGKENKTKLGNAMSVQLWPKELGEMIDALTEIREKHLPKTP